MTGVWSWVLTVVGVTCFLLAGRRVWWAWYVGLASQVLWLAYSVATAQWGFLAGVVVYSWTYAVNAARWTRERRVSTLPAEQRSLDEEERVLVFDGERHLPPEVVERYGEATLRRLAHQTRSRSKALTPIRARRPVLGGYLDGGRAAKNLRDQRSST